MGNLFARRNLYPLRQRYVDTDLNEKKNQHTFTWKIFNFSFLTQKKCEFIESSVFIAKSLNETSWSLLMYPRGDYESKSGEMGCFLKRSQSCNGPSDIKCDFTIAIFAGNVTLACFKDCRIFNKGLNCGWYKFSKEQSPNDFDDTLTIQCFMNSEMPGQVQQSKSIEIAEVNIDRCSFIWSIKILNFTCLETKKLLCTGTSRVELIVQTPDDNIKISIRRIGSLNRKYVMCRMALLDLEGIEQASEQAAHLFEDEDIRKAWKFPPFLKKSKLISEKEKYIKDDSVTLHCEILVSTGTISSVVENKDKCHFETLPVMPCIDNFSALKAGIKRMYADKSQTDVELIVNEKIFPAHKFVLSANSPVFFAMFNHNLVENKSGQVYITDLEAQTVSFLLEFMYTGTVKEIDCEMAADLILAADKYQVETLKEECSGFLRSVLTVSSVCDVLVTADLIQDKPLRDAAVSFIKKRSEEVFKSVAWKRYVENNPNLASGVIGETSTLLAQNNS